jgi:hypothetical protein
MFLVCILILTCSSCVTLPSAQTGQLAASGKTLDQAIAESFDLTSSIMFERTYLLHTDSDKSYNDYLDSANDNFRAQCDRRLKYTAVIQSYLEALNSLATRNDAKAIRESAINLDASLMGVQQYVPNSQQNMYKTMSAGLGSASDFVTRYVTQGVQRKYMKSAMDTAKPAFDKICALLEDELYRTNLTFTVNQQSVITRLIAIRNTETNISKRRDWDMYIGKRIHACSLLNKSFTTGQQILRQLPKAHNEIRLTLDKKMKMKEAISTLVSEVKDLKECYDQITATKDK